MLRELAVNTRVIYYLMAMMGIVGVMAKAVNQLTLNQMLKAAGNMSKSTHRLIKLVRAKYEHACMVHDSVENTDTFVEKYIYEYRGFLFRIHTWRQMELLTVWFAGILAAIGAFECYVTFGVSEAAYQYVTTGLAEIILLSVVSRLSDEQYKLNAVRMYMVDYLENSCSFRMKRQRTSEREELSVIAADNTGKQSGTDRQESISENEKKEKGKGFFRKPKVERTELPINIEGEPREVEPARKMAENQGKGESGEFGDSARDRGTAIREEARQAVREVLKERMDDEERPALREEAIRQILEEFLA